MYQTLNYVSGSVPASGELLEHKSIAADFIQIVKVKAVPSASGGSAQLDIYKETAGTTLLFATDAFAGGEIFYPALVDGASVSEGEEGFPVPYKDLDAGQQLHIKLINNDTVSKTFTITIIYYVPTVKTGNFVQGSVLFADANGVLTQDNANLFWDDSNNRLGLGTTAPTNLLHVSRNGASGVRFTSNDFNQLLLEDGDQADASTPFHFIGSIGGNFTIGSANRLGTGTTGSQTRIRLDSGGRVGIGTESPSQRLHVYDGSIFLEDPDLNSNPDIRIQNDARLWQLQVRGAESDIFTIRDGTAGANRLIVDSAGNVGIGTSSPATLLHASSGVSGAPMTTEPGLLVENSGNAAVVVGTPAANYGLLSFSDPGGIRGAILYDHGTVLGAGADAMLFRTANADRLTIDGSGNVGIGTTSPATSLHVKQSGATAAIPVIELEQLDVSEPMIDFDCAIGVGNGIEAVGAKSLTVTHFVKVRLPGGLVRYLQVGTIA